jgi:lipoprotein-releasing system permease protein
MGRFMKEGSLSALAQRHEGLAGIVLGRELALRLGAFQGDVLRLLSPRMELGPLGMLPKVREFRVAGVFEVGMFEYDSNLALVSLQAAQEFFGLGDRVTGLQLRLRDIYQAPQLARTLQEQLGYTVVVRDWVQMNRSLFAALKLEKLAMFVILVLIILVAAFNIVSTLMMTVLQKERDIAILRAMGASRRGIMGVFMLQGLLIGLVGTAIGLAGGLGLSYLLDAYQLIKLPPDVYYLSHLPARINVGDFLLVSASALLIAFLATLWPAWQAASTSPIEPLRYE